MYCSFANTVHDDMMCSTVLSDFFYRVCICCLFLFVVVVVINCIIISCHRSFLPGTSLEPMVIPTARASNFTLH